MNLERLTDVSPPVLSMLAEWNLIVGEFLAETLGGGRRLHEKLREVVGLLWTKLHRRSESTKKLDVQQRAQEREMSNSLVCVCWRI